MTALRAGLSWLYRMSDRLVGGVFALGVLTAPFYRVDYLRAHLLGTATTPATAGLAVLALGVGLAWRSLLRRDFVWADPAELTWADLTDRRVGTIGRRLWAGWAVRFAVAGYLAAVGALLLGTSSWLAGGCALFAAGRPAAAARARPGTAGRRAAGDRSGAVGAGGGTGRGGAGGLRRHAVSRAVGAHR
jgi:hypothetical protein